MEDVGPEAAVVEVFDSGLWVDEKVGVDGVGDIEGVVCGGTGGEDGAVVGPTAWQEGL